jgi:SEC-C motif-containing protein
MRSRYAAFALGEVDYLIRTIHPEHADASVPRETLAAALRGACRTYKYTGLSVLEHRSEGDVATVVFRAKVFDKGRDLSFTEASTFERVDGAWRYRSGETLERSGERSS